MPFAAAAQPLFAPSEIAQPAFASDLLGDFGEPTKEISSGLISTSPTPGMEFPGNEAYRPEEQLDNFAATTKVIENTGDSFDAFASKFDRAAEVETNGGDPFLDAFGGPTAMDTSSDGKWMNVICNFTLYLLFVTTYSDNNFSYSLGRFVGSRLGNDNERFRRTRRF